MARHSARTAARQKSQSLKSHPRPIWQGSINFGLVTIPVALYSAETPHRMDFDLLDRRDFSPVRYRRVNEKTGREVPWDQIVKGYKRDEGQYIALNEADFQKAAVEATQSIDIMDFVDAAEISPLYFDKPYYLEPLKNGRRAYALLREVLRRTSKAGIAKVVIRSRQHLAALMPQGPMLILNLLRFFDELRDRAALDLPGGSPKELKISEKEIKMAKRLVETMVDAWKPEKYRDDYRDQLLDIIEKKTKAGETKVIEESKPKTARDKRDRKVVDIMHLLKRSVEEAQKKEEPPRRRKAG